MAPAIDGLHASQQQMSEWYDHLHRHPERSMQEKTTALFIAITVKSFGYQAVTSIGVRGAVASLTNGHSASAIGIPADFDALPIQEDNYLPYKSEIPGVAHLCGHDCHTTMALTAAKYLVKKRHW